MNRRHFLSLLGASAAAMVLDPELLLWKPRAKTIFLPPATSFASSLEPVLRKGDIITIDGHYMINPSDFLDPWKLQEWVVTDVCGASCDIRPHAPKLVQRIKAAKLKWDVSALL